MESVQINIGHWMHRRYLRDKSTNSDQPKGQESDEDDDDNVLGKDRIFPQLRELKLHKPGDMGKVSEIMEYIVKECPRLQALEWREVSHGREFSYEVFADILEEGFWPHLSSIDIKELPWLQDSTLQRILKTYQQPIVTPPTTPLLSATSTPPQTPTSSPPTPLPWHYGSPKPKRQLVRTTLTRLDVPILHLYESTFDLIRPHFTTLRHINLLNVNTSTRTYVFEVLINCSTLEVLYSNLMTIGDFIDLLPDPTNNPPNNHDPTPGKVADTKANAGQEYREPKWKKPWICKNLQELHMVLDMGIDEPSFRPYMLTPYARPYTPRELHLASLFFQQLGKLTRLRVLDMGFHRYISGPRVTHTSVLPFQLCAGLSHLQSLRSLEVVQFRGRQDLNLWDLQWMLDYWPGLREIGGSPLSARVDPEIVSGENNTSPLIYHLEFARILRERGIKIIPWTTSYYHNTNCSHKKMSELDQECVARWRERMLLEAEEHKALGQGADLMGQSTD
ncbi:hypothetical protein EMPS_06970 [Entomortierella parvispora]|uniref:Uncharacterized protein n=1 Tax=Entomortierella parvispora TaxID=205924 RepID=A0A9P3HE02_9FUNG|nr:hypothetical protein EMPS_06970 [Entomortierella parvispora]